MLSTIQSGVDLLGTTATLSLFALVVIWGLFMALGLDVKRRWLRFSGAILTGFSFSMLLGLTQPDALEAMLPGGALGNWVYLNCKISNTLGFACLLIWPAAIASLLLATDWLFIDYIVNALGLKVEPAPADIPIGTGMIRNIAPPEESPLMEPRALKRSSLEPLVSDEKKFAAPPIEEAPAFDGLGDAGSATAVLEEEERDPEEESFVEPVSTIVEEAPEEEAPEISTEKDPVPASEISAEEEPVPASEGKDKWWAYSGDPEDREEMLEEEDTDEMEEPVEPEEPAIQEEEEEPVPEGIAQEEAFEEEDMEPKEEMENGMEETDLFSLPSTTPDAPPDIHLGDEVDEIMSVSEPAEEEALLESASSEEAEWEAAEEKPEEEILPDEPEEEAPPAAMDPVLMEEAALLQSAAELVVREEEASISFLQKRMGLGYFKAAKIINVLEKTGVVAKEENNTSRKVMLNPDEISGLQNDIANYLKNRDR